MERDDRAPVATFFVEAPLVAETTATLGERAAHHARVKRLVVADRVRLSDGAGRVAVGSIESIMRGALDVAVTMVDTVPMPSPIHLCAPIADRDRMLWLAEKATELGAASWQSVRFHRSASVSPRGEGPAFAEKLRARMISALEQSGGAWLPNMLPEITVEALEVGSEQFPIVLDLAGDSIADVAASVLHQSPAVLIGPEGGIEPAELDALVARGWKRARLAGTTLRFETAGIAALAVLRAVHMSKGAPTNGR
ncbi:MAG: RsmE family RNA methyltransferase [bacterium]